ncbi:MAG: hypothetical protein EOO42_23935, partial [Flavobacteriales bacterium]
MSSTSEKKLLPEFESIKDDQEEILWTGKPKFIPYIFTGALAGLSILAFALIWFSIARNTGANNDSGPSSYFWLFGLIPLVVGIISFVNRIFSFPNTAYAYSDKRIMMRTGFIGTDFKTIDYDKISDIEVTVDIIERMYNV